MVDVGVRYFGLILLGLIIFYAVRAYHNREMAKIETREMELDGWVKLRMSAVPFAWQCPECGGAALTSEAINMHLNSSTSVCAWFGDQRDAERVMAEAEAARGQGPAVTVGAELPTDDWPALGTAEDAAEVTAGDQDGGG